MMILCAAALILLAVIVIALYLFYYRSMINRRLNDPTHKQNTRLWSPMRASITAIISILTIFSVICMLFATSRPEMISTPAQTTYHAQILSLDEMKEGYLSQYSIKENTGYTKQEQVLDDVRYTYFISTEKTDPFHPSFLIYAEYIGAGTPKYYDANVSFQTFEGQEMTNVMVGGSELKASTVCIMGNAFADSTISCNVDFYEVQREEFDLEKLQKETTPLVILIPVK